MDSKETKQELFVAPFEYRQYGYYKDEKGALKLGEIPSTPAQRTWIGLNHVEIDSQSKKYDNAVYFVIGALWAEAKLKEKNT